VAIINTVRKRDRKSQILGILFATPAFIFLFVFLVWPILVGVQYSFTKASGYGDKEAVGFSNYTEAFGDPDLYSAFGRNIVFAAIVVTASISIAFVLSYFLYRRVPGWRFLQTTLLIPFVMPTVVIAFLWKFMLEPENGLVNSVLRAANLDALAGPWLTGQGTALFSVSIVQTWHFVPFAMLLLFGAMLSLDGEVLEAAEIDGAGPWRTMTAIVLPMVRPMVLLVGMVLTVQLFRSFDLVYLLTQGGPVGSTTIATLFVFVEGFVNSKYGYANALGLIIGVVLVLIAVTPRFIARYLTRASRGAP